MAKYEGIVLSLLQGQHARTRSHIGNGMLRNLLALHWWQLSQCISNLGHPYDLQTRQRSAGACSDFAHIRSAPLRSTPLRASTEQSQHIRISRRENWALHKEAPGCRGQRANWKTGIQPRGGERSRQKLRAFFEMQPEGVEECVGGHRVWPEIHCTSSRGSSRPCTLRPELHAGVPHRQLCGKGSRPLLR